MIFIHKGGSASADEQMEYNYASISDDTQKPDSGRKQKRSHKLAVLLCIVIAAAWLVSLAATVLLTYTITVMHNNGGSDKLTAALSETVKVIREHYYFYDADETELTNAA